MSLTKYCFILSISLLLIRPGSADCPKNCLVCSSSGICTKCQYGFYLSAGVCRICPVGCGVCDSSGCSLCDDQFYLSKNGTCLKCSDPNCKQCNDTKCFKCIDAYYLTSSGVCLRCYDMNCKQCSASNCVQCMDGYTMNKSSCRPCVPNCQICDYQCLVCQSGYYLDILFNDQRICVACRDVNCLKCDQFYCNQCKDGYALNSGVCVKKSCYCAPSVYSDAGDEDEDKKHTTNSIMHLLEQ